ncbi:phage DNA ejection protein [Mixta calida]|uniref:phage DNA ejection protein n=1 Tax=Mixta calida TaxID=665913 RepID=UPI00289E6AF7|nr:phage DNA ejection protein [Mixta calida]
MATFQLAGMPSLQVANQNAPGVGVAPVPQYVTQPNLGQTLIGGLGNLAGAYAQNKQLQFQKDFGQAYASGDREALKQLAASNPDQIQAIRQGMGFIDEDQAREVGSAAMDLQLAAQGGPEAVANALQKNAGALNRLGINPAQAFQLYQQDPQQFTRTADLIGMHALGPEKYFNFQDKAANRQVTIRGQDVSAETARRGQDISASTARRGQDITMRGQDISASTTRRGQDMSMDRYNRTAGGAGARSVQLSDGRSVTVSGKLHGAGANAFYEGVDNDGNVIRVPASAISAPATSAASAQSSGMNKDMNLIIGAGSDDLSFMTGVTGGNGNPALGADVRSRFAGKDERQLYNAAQRIQGRMRNQGIAAARDMGASGINTVAEAKMYFQGMPQIDYSSPTAMQESVKNIKQYTDQYNSQYKVDVGSQGQQQTAAPQGGVYTSKSGIQFKVK